MTGKPLSAAQAARQNNRNPDGTYAPMFTAGKPTGIQLVRAIENRIEQIRDPRKRVPAVLVSAAAPARTIANRGEWWDQAYLSAEYRPDDGVPRLPEEIVNSDGTLTTLKGRGLTGRRRANRMRYMGANGTTLRMPSKSQIRRYVKGTGNTTVDVPFGITDAYGASRQGWARVTKLPDGSWDVQVLGETSDENQLIMSESISATLENRDPRFMSAAELRERRQERMATLGARLSGEKTLTRSKWLKDVRWDESTGSMYVSTDQGRVYRYDCDKAEYETIMADPAEAGRRFNEFKARHEGGKYKQRGSRCEACGRFQPEDGTHACPAGMRATVASDPVTMRTRQYMRQRPKLGRTLDSDNVLRDPDTGRILRDKDGDIAHKHVGDQVRAGQATGAEANPADYRSGWTGAEVPRTGLAFANETYATIDRSQEPTAGWSWRAYTTGVGTCPDGQAGKDWIGFDAPAGLVAASLRNSGKHSPATTWARRLASSRLGRRLTFRGRLRSLSHADGEGLDVTSGVFFPADDLGDRFARAEREMAAGGPDRRPGLVVELREALGDRAGAIRNVRTGEGGLMFDL